MAENPFPSLPNDPQVKFREGGSYRNNPDLETYYKSKSQGYADDIEFLEGRIDEVAKLDQPLIDKAAVPDLLLAESVKKHNEAVFLIKSLGAAAVSCGCSMVGVATTEGFSLTTLFVDLKEVRADRKNLNDIDYSGGEPLSDNGDIIIIDSTTINTDNLGDGQDTTVSVGASVSYFRVLNGNELPLSCGNCQELFDAQVAAIALRSSLDPVPQESSRSAEASGIKAEREELLKERWTLTSAKGSTQTRKTQVDSFLDAQNYKGP
jgi:hypothetical protein